MSDFRKNIEWIERKLKERIHKINNQIAKHKDEILQLQEESQLNQAIMNELLNEELSSEGNEEFSIELIPEPTKVKVPKQRISTKRAERKESLAKAHAWHLDRMKDKERKRK
jgi:hypothetical protein